MATLKVKNRSREKIDLRLDDGRGRIEIPAERPADLDEAALRSKSFVALFESGAIEFVAAARPSEDERALAKRVIPALIDGLAGRMKGLRGMTEKTVAQMAHQRDEYNRAWEGARDILNRARQTAAAGEAIIEAANRYLKPAAGHDALDALRTELETLDKADTAKAGFNLADWYQQRSAKEQELRRAEAALAGDQKAADSFAAQYKARLESLSADADRLKGQADAAIGRKLDW
jgi:hypothetical protein